MEIKDYFSIIWRRKWVIFITLVSASTVAIVGASAVTPVYEASATLRLSSDAPFFNGRPYSLDYADRLMNTYIEIIDTVPVRTELERRLIVIDRLVSSANAQLELETLDLLQMNVENIANTELMRITAEHPDPAVAAEAANVLATMLVEQSRGNLAGGGTSRPEQDQTPTSEGTLAFSVIESAELPEKPVESSKMMIVVLGVFTGLIGGLGLGFLSENLDERIYTAAK